MFEAMTNTFTLPGSVLQKNFQVSERQTAAREFKAVGAGANTVGFARTARPPGMDNKIIDTQQNRPRNFFAERRSRLLQHQLIGSSEVHQIVAMNDDRIEFG